MGCNDWGCEHGTPLWGSGVIPFPFPRWRLRRDRELPRCNPRGLRQASLRSSSYPQSPIRGIRLECGCLAAWTPVRLRPIRPYAAEVYPQLFAQPDCGVLPPPAFREIMTVLKEFESELHSSL